MATEEEKPPAVSRELVAFLEKRFPDRCPDASTPPHEVCELAGSVRVVRLLKRIHEKQSEVVL